MRKTKILQVRLSEQEHAFVQLKMEEHGYLNRSDYVRICIICPIEHDQKRMQKMIYEINKIGVNLNQITRKMHSMSQINFEVQTSIDFIRIQLNEVIEAYRKL
ncbi:plasmid mobilization protein [Massilia sp. GCM10023247]|uniref:plasmid mobilization protein n=1 Tax=Massilia sp. GCM10023247 TaxID=3252643 RepID=UPI00360770FF